MNNYEERNKGIEKRAIYILGAEQEHKYVGQGKMRNIAHRLTEQFGFDNPNNLPPSVYCQQHKPCYVEDIKDIGEVDYDVAEMIEDAYTIHYKRLYGKNKVSGGHSCASEKGRLNFLKMLLDNEMIKIKDLKKVIEENDNIILENTKIQ